MGTTNSSEYAKGEQIKANEKSLYTVDALLKELGVEVEPALV